MDAQHRSGIGQRARAAALVTLALVHASTVIALTGPGFASFDTAYQWWMARHFDISTLWPPSYIITFRLLEAALPGVSGPTAWFGINVAFNCIGAALVAYVCARSLLSALLCYLVVAASPVSWILLPHIWSDVALACVLLFVIGCLLLASQEGGRTSVRRASLTISFLGLFAATGFRHNAVLAVVPVVMLWCHIAVSPGRSTSTASAKPMQAVALGLVMSFTFLGVHSLSTRLIAAQRSDTWAITAIWDLQSLSVATGKNFIPTSISANTDIADLGASFDPTNAVTLYVRSRALWANSTTGLTPQQSRELATGWLNAVREEPVKYAAHRWHVFMALLGAVNHSAAGTRIEPIQTPFKDNPPRKFWWEAGANHWQRVSLFLSAQWLSSPMATLIVAALAIVRGLIQGLSRYARANTSAMQACIERPGQQWWFALATAASGMCYLLGLLPSVPTADMRYVFWPVAAYVLTAVLISTSRPSAVASSPATKPAS